MAAVDIIWHQAIIQLLHRQQYGVLHHMISIIRGPQHRQHTAVARQHTRQEVARPRHQVHRQVHQEVAEYATDRESVEHVTETESILTIPWAMVL